MSYKNIRIKRLNTALFIEEAGALLHKEYIATGTWVFSNNNPSQLQVMTNNNRAYLTDRITPYAIWFGAFDTDTIVGCIRLFKATSDVPFEIETYPSASDIVKQYIEPNKPNLFEASRACVDSAYKGQAILPKLYLAIAEYCAEEKAAVFGSASNGYVKSVLRHIEWPCKKEEAFKFEETDPAAVNFYLANTKNGEIENMIKNIKSLKETRHRKTFNILDALNLVAPIFPVPMYWHDTKGVVLGINAQALKGMDKSLEEVLGKTPYDFYPKEIAAHIWQHSKKVLKYGDTLTQEEYVYDISGKCIRTYLAIKAPLYDEDGQMLGVLGTSIDMTAEKEAERTLIMAKEVAEAANCAKTEFVQNMQHDIRTPSAGLFGVLDVLAKAEPEGRKKEALEMAVSASKRLLELCNDAVQFGDLSGHARPRIERDLDLRALVQSIIELNRPAAFAKAIGIHLKIDSSVPPHIASDEFRISRILINLLGNAIKFSHSGEIILNMTASLEAETRKGILTIEIKDEGIGIARDKVDKIFEKFTRGVASNTNQYPSSGLGLYVVKTFMDELEGDIYVVSFEGEGTYFKLDIPFKGLLADMRKEGAHIDEHFHSSIQEMKEQEALIKSENEKNFSHKTLFSHTLLLIEDDKTCLFAEENLLSHFTYKIDSTENVKDALEKLAKKRYDLVISDLGLPDGSGNDIVAHIKANPESPNYQTPFVAMTAHQDAAKHKEAREAGFETIGTKPLSTEKAVEFLKTYPAQEKDERDVKEWTSVIDIALGMQRIGTQTEDKAIKILSLLYQALQEDIPVLKEAQSHNDIEKAREILHKIRGGLCYSGTPRLEEAFKLLHNDMKRVSALSEITELFTLVYHEVKLFMKQFEEWRG